jgi:ABC-type nitrate/sulfonate/bicarbonate transport system substrate-binding protein
MPFVDGTAEQSYSYLAYMISPFRLGGVPEHFNLPFHLLEEDGGSPISFTWQDFPGGTGALCKALESGALDIATVLTEGAVAFNARGGNLVLPAFWVQTPLRWGIHTGSTSGINSVAGLKGKPFAISRPGSGSTGSGNGFSAPGS